MSTDHRRYGLSLGVSPREPLERVGDLAAKAEEAGIEALWYIDFQNGMKDVYAAMYLAALHTERATIGAAVTNLITRHPTVTANAHAALDELSHGRAVLGLGAGWSAVYGAGGRPSKAAEIRQGIEEFRQLFTGEPVDLYGTTVQVAAADRQIPIYVAASQPLLLRTCGEVADGVILMGAADPDFCRWQLEFIYEGLEKSGRSRDDFTVDLFVSMSIDEDEDKALADVRAWATSQAATFKDWKAMPPAWEHFRPEFESAAESYHLVEHLSLRAGHKHVVSDTFVKSVAIAGNQESSIARLRELWELDLDRITFSLMSGGRERRLDEIKNDVIPALV